MLQDFFSALYGALHGPQGPIFVDQIYPQIGTALLAWTIIVSALYYYWLGWITARLNMTRHWVIALVVDCVLCMVTVLGVSRLALGAWDVDAPIVVTLMLIQGLYAAVFFAIVSAAIKWRSPNARCTPF